LRVSVVSKNTPQQQTEFKSIFELKSIFETK